LRRAVEAAQDESLTGRSPQHVMDAAARQRCTGVVRETEHVAIKTRGALRILDGERNEAQPFDPDRIARGSKRERGRRRATRW
jgi:hypothetical protein